MNAQEGSIELGTLVILVFLSALLGSAVLFSSSLMKYYRTYATYNHEKDKVLDILYEITREIQPLKNDEYDHRESYAIRAMENKFNAYGFQIRDVSSGYHLDFLTDSDLQDPGILAFLFPGNNASQYIRFRNGRGLSTDLEPARNLIRSEAWDSCVAYGWINGRQTDSYAFRQVSAAFKSTDADKLFPLVNDFPLINVNMVNPDMLSPLIAMPGFKIEKPDEKMKKLKERLAVGPVSVSEISSILNVPYTNAIFDYLGTKTAFWKFSLTVKAGAVLSGVIAAIPEKYGERQEIKEYRLLDWSASDENY
jgi:hypothetical protein